MMLHTCAKLKTELRVKRTLRSVPVSRCALIAPGIYTLSSYCATYVRFPPKTTVVEVCCEKPDSKIYSGMAQSLQKGNLKIRHYHGAGGVRTPDFPHAKRTLYH
ncbi:hypothetical protein M514_04301 [Trichuris suis]|uniref:Uncharacterized protein n=1 Tax=Trichuris suis TaxID=68888 RepID=A0A085MCC1_9BILA|nr:hypothetical protein M513_04301 [Trichuris suis]KFD71741.1 hypothetical protein M514_04301 [Trichuris suis]